MEAGPALPEESLAELYDEAPCGYLASAPDGTILRVNQTLLRWTGYAPEELTGVRRLMDLLTVPGRIFYQTHLQTRLSMHGEVREATLDLLRADGTVLPILLNAVLHRDDGGQPWYVRSMIVDLTERRRYELELLGARRRAEQLAAVVDAAGDAILVMSPDGTILTWNRGAERLFGWPAAQTVGRRVGQLLVPSDRQEEHARCLAELTRGLELWLETVRVDRSGRRLDVSLALTPHTEALGEVGAISAIIRDVSDRRRAEAEQRRAERLQTVGTLAGGVAHEVNNQVMAVLGYGEFLRRALGPDHPQAGDLGEMMTAAARAAQISHQLLAFSQQALIMPRVLDLHRLASGAAERLSSELGSEKALLIAPNRSRHRVRADRTQIEQVLINLTANARDAMAPGGQLTITVEDTVLTEADPSVGAAEDVVAGSYVLLSVQDTGSGIDPADLPHVFEPFFTTKPVGEGTGLGLSMVYGIVKQHHGQVSAASEPGAGTTIRIYLPAIDAPAQLDGGAEAGG
jgi:PAS domain S-box-containing protein